MRIVGGEWRGRLIDSPKGRDVSRPTTDRVREAIASMLESALPEGIEGSRVLDAFAGSGALGLEVLSRGAEHAVFFDLDRSAAALVKRNLAKLSCAPARFQVPVRVRSALRCFLAVQSMQSFSISIGRLLLL